MFLIVVKFKNKILMLIYLILFFKNKINEICIIGYLNLNFMDFLFDRK